MIKIAVAGGAGRMGKAVICAIVNTDAVMLSTVTVQENTKEVGVDVGVLAGIGYPLGVLTSSDLLDKDFDVLIDFTTPKATLSNVQICQSQCKKMVIGTTGFTKTEKGQIHQAAKQIPIVFSPNMSIGVNVIFALLEKAVKLLGKGTEVEIIEAHHRNKQDAPSGTALKMGQIIAKTLDKELNTRTVYGYQSNTCVRDKKTIGFSSIRAGDIVGEHTAMFLLDGERVEITHKATSRKAFARGAVQAAKWLFAQKPGLYSMENILFNSDLK